VFFLFPNSLSQPPRSALFMQRESSVASYRAGCAGFFGEEYRAFRGLIAISIALRAARVLFFFPSLNTCEYSSHLARARIADELSQTSSPDQRYANVTSDRYILNNNVSSLSLSLSLSHRRWNRGGSSRFLLISTISHRDRHTSGRIASARVRRAREGFDIARDLAQR